MVRIRKRRLMWFSAAVLLLVVGYVAVRLLQGNTISFYGIPHFSVPPNESTVESHGLRVTLLDAREVQDGVKVVYAFEWVPVRQNETQMRLMRPFGTLEVLFWDADGKQLYGTKENPDYAENRITVQFFTSLEFADQSWPYVHHGEAIVELPANARFIGIRIGSYKTTKVSFPFP